MTARTAAPSGGAQRGTGTRRICPASVLVLGVLGLALTGCGSDLLGSTSVTSGPTASTTSPTSSTLPPLTGEVAVAFPVVACAATFGTPEANRGWKPTILVAPIPTALVGKVEFYSDGIHTVLGPDGWTCSEIQPSEGARGLVVYPANDPNPPIGGPPVAGTEGIFATYDTTGHPQGIALVCPFFTIPSWQQKKAICPPTKPSGEDVSMPTPDIASVTDPEGVVGNLEGSGGVHPVTGAVIFPQAMPAVTNGSSIDVAAESCSLIDTTLCPTVLSDFEVREFPVPTAPG